jgi:hypothetical protein
MRYGHSLAALVICGALLWALQPGHPYSFFISLRWVCMIAFVYLAVLAVIRGKQGCAWIMGSMAIVYNPLIPFHLTKAIWSTINIATICIAVGATFVLSGRAPPAHSVPPEEPSEASNRFQARRKLLARFWLAGWGLLLAGFGIVLVALLNRMLSDHSSGSTPRRSRRR